MQQHLCHFNNIQNQFRLILVNQGYCMPDLRQLARCRGAELGQAAEPETAEYVGCNVGTTALSMAA